MSLSKPEILAYTGASALLGVILASILGRPDKHSSEEALCRDNEAKKVGKQMPLQRKSTMNLDGELRLNRAQSLGQESFNLS